MWFWPVMFSEEGEVTDDEPIIFESGPKNLDRFWKERELAIKKAKEKVEEKKEKERRLKEEAEEEKDRRWIEERKKMEERKKRFATIKKKEKPKPKPKDRFGRGMSRSRSRSRSRHRGRWSRSRSRSPRRRRDSGRSRTPVRYRRYSRSRSSSRSRYRSRSFSRSRSRSRSPYNSWRKSSRSRLSSSPSSEPPQVLEARQLINSLAKIDKVPAAVLLSPKKPDRSISLGEYQRKKNIEKLKLTPTIAPVEPKPAASSPSPPPLTLPVSQSESIPPSIYDSVDLNDPETPSGSCATLQIPTAPLKSPPTKKDLKPSAPTTGLVPSPPAKVKEPNRKPPTLPAKEKTPVALAVSEVTIELSSDSDADQPESPPFTVHPAYSAVTGALKVQSPKTAEVKSANSAESEVPKSTKPATPRDLKQDMLNVPPVDASKPTVSPPPFDVRPPDVISGQALEKLAPVTVPSSPLMCPASPQSPMFVFESLPPPKDSPPPGLHPFIPISPVFVPLLSSAKFPLLYLKNVFKPFLPQRFQYQKRS